MRKFIVFTLFLVFAISSLIAQTDFRKGYIISNNGDTLFGYLDYRNDYLNCNRCIFKLNEDDDPTEYAPGEIKAYRFIESKYYISTYIEDLKKDVFLEYLIDGIVDVYYYKDRNDSYYYISKEDARLIELKNEEKEFYRYEGEHVQNYVKLSKEYIGVLKYLFNDSRITLEKANYVDLNHKSLINIANEYHNNVCEGEECIIFEKKLPPTRFEFSFLAFSDITFLNMLSDDYDAFNYNTDYNYSLGLAVSMYLPRLNERISVYAQGLYTSNSFSSSYFDDASFPTYFYSYNKLQYLNLNIGFKYGFPKGKIRPEFIIGWAKNIILDSNEERLKEIESPVGIINTYKLESNALSTNYNGIALGAGLNFLRYKKIDFNFNLQYDFIIGGYNLNMNTIRVGFGIKY